MINFLFFVFPPNFSSFSQIKMTDDCSTGGEEEEETSSWEQILRSLGTRSFELKVKQQQGKLSVRRQPNLSEFNFGTITNEDRKEIDKEKLSCLRWLLLIYLLEVELFLLFFAGLTLSSWSTEHRRWNRKKIFSSKIRRQDVRCLNLQHFLIVKCRRWVGDEWMIK